MIKILQFGEGNFLRAFAEHYIQAQMKKAYMTAKLQYASRGKTMQL